MVFLLVLLDRCVLRGNHNFLHKQPNRLYFNAGVLYILYKYESAHVVVTLMHSSLTNKYVLV